MTRMVLLAAALMPVNMPDAYEETPNRRRWAERRVAMHWSGGGPRRGSRRKYDTITTTDSALFASLPLEQAARVLRAEWKRDRIRRRNLRCGL